MQQPEVLHTQSVEEIILDHAVTSTDQRLVCSLAIVSKAWRTAAQTAAVGRLHVALKICECRWFPEGDNLPQWRGVRAMRKLVSFTQWLPKHVHMVRELQLDGYDIWELLDQKDKDCFMTLLNQSLQAAASSAVIGAEQRLQPLGLQSYCSNMAFHTWVVQALPAASLKTLRMLATSSHILDFIAPLQQLTNLQNLELHGGNFPNAKYLNDISEAECLKCMAAISQLSSLTSLCIRLVGMHDMDNSGPAVVQLLPVQLLRLDLHLSRSRSTSCITRVLDFTHLTQLTGLSFKGEHAGAKLPAQLLHFSTDTSTHGCNITSLQQLDTLDIGGSTEEQEELVQLGMLPKLQTLSLRYWTPLKVDSILTVAPAWSQLKQLRDINVCTGDGYQRFLDPCTCTTSECLELIVCLSDVTWLTQLRLSMRLIADQGATTLAICQNVAKLRMLQKLTLVFDVSARAHGSQVAVPWAQDDAKHLATLTQLSKLKLGGQGFGVMASDATVVELLRSMKQLQNLCVPVQSAGVLSFISELKGLRKLVCYGLQEAEQVLQLTFSLAALDTCVGGSPVAVPWAQNDAVHLASYATLTQLTKLILQGSGLEVVASDATVVELELSMKRLQNLCVPVQSDVLLPFIGQLKGLEKLVCHGLQAAEQQAGLQHLRGLKRLHELWGFEECSENVLAEFWAAVHS